MAATMPSTNESYGFIDRYHQKRRTKMLAVYPQIRSLMVEDPSFKYVAVATAVTQIAIACLLRESSIVNILLFAVFVGSLFTCAIGNSIHEFTHDAAFPGKPLWNKILGTAVNFGLGWPSYGAYHATHRNHHAYLGSNLDSKYPDMEEASYYDQSTWLRLCFIVKAPLMREGRFTKHVKNVKPTTFKKLNKYAVWTFNVIFVIFAGWRSYLYLFASMYINSCFYVQGSKNFVDHWCDDEKPNTRSQYGWANLINYNIGYHNEHHDFPNIPGRYAPLLMQIAPEFYSDPRMRMPSHFSAVYELFTAPFGHGITKHANKLALDRVETKDE